MSLLLTYTHNYLVSIDPESIIRTYNDITPSTIEEMKYNLNHQPPFTTSLTRHVFIKLICIKYDFTFIYDSFIQSSEFASLISSVRLPHNHRIEILYVVEDSIATNTYLIGNEFVITNTINECNLSLSRITNHITPWMNRIYNEKCLIGSLNEALIIKLLKNDRTIDERHIDTYYEELVVCNAMFGIIMRNDPDLGINHNSLHNVLTTIDDRIDIEIPDGLHEGRSGILTEPIVNAIMNMNKWKYSVTSIDDILWVGIGKDTLKDRIIHGY